MPGYYFLIDFDGTITDRDAVDTLISLYSTDPSWKEAEQRWVEGEIDSAECMSLQLSGVQLAEGQFDEFVSDIKVDPGFGNLLDFLGSKGIPVRILSDGFDLLISSILGRHGFSGIDLKCNTLKFDGKRFSAEFPHKADSCGSCAHCKQSTIRRMRSRLPGTRFIFVGDGRSDICASKEADILFAKGALAQECIKNGRDFHSFTSLADVREKLTDIL